MKQLADASVPVVLALLLSAGCGGVDEGGAASDADLEAIHAVSDSFEQAVRDQDPERFAALFTDDATYASNDGRLWESREEILAAARQWMRVPQRPKGRTVRAEVSEDLAYLVEEYSSEVQPPESAPVTVTGRSMAVFRRQEDGGWKIEALVVNRDPAP